ncbi:unnamed protein product [Miscanthus lutarioriparius]|uniref:Uncharacterized protein n=1 Tax=Miscanthus lutarioriparius TaxID=422564 RepID=A0A811NQ50_9POAL|nr:unnamed protein product [Miscanthus lutarioriparius]
MARRDAEVARRDAEAEQEVLRQRIMELEQQLLEERLEHERANMENISQNGSNSRHHVSPKSENDGVGIDFDAEFHEDDNAYAEQSNECEYTTMRRIAAAPSQQPPQSTMRAPPSQQPPQSTI